MKTILIQCENRLEFEKMKRIVAANDCVLTSMDADHFTIACLLSEKGHKYMKRKCTLVQVADL